MLGGFFDSVAISVARREIHFAIDVRVGRFATRVIAQGLFDHAESFDKLPPIHRRQETQTADAIAERDLIGCLLLALNLHQLLDGNCPVGQLVFEPHQRQGHRVRVLVKSASELGRELAIHHRTRARQFRHDEDQASRVLFHRFDHLIGPSIGLISMQTGGSHPSRDATQILYQCQTKHDGNGPEFPELERRDGLVGCHHRGQAFGSDPAVDMRDQFQSNIVHPGKAGRRALQQPWKLRAVGLGKMAAGGPDLLFDQVKIVQQPFVRRRHPAVGCHRGHNHLMRFEQHRFVLLQAAQQVVRSSSRVHFVTTGQSFCMPLELDRTE